MNGANLSGDVVIVGLGPAGRALAYRCAQRGLRVVAIDKHPFRTWTPTYGAWTDELPSWLGPSALAAVAVRPSAFGTREWKIERDYAVFTTAGLQQELSLDTCTVVQGSAIRLGAGVVRLADGRHIYGRVVIDARGVREPRAPQQTAFGIVVPEETAEPLLEGRSAWFMDWRQPAKLAAMAAPSFLYAIPLGGGATLLEETCLAGQPPLGFAELRTRLQSRLSAHGVAVTGAEPVERVRFAVCTPASTRSPQGVLAIGSRGGILHPATGYSVAASLSVADLLADAIAFRTNPRAKLWPLSARLVYALRERGLASFLRLSPTDIPAFFDAFFALPVPLQRSYLSGRADVTGLVTAMKRIFTASPWPARRQLAAGVMRPELQ